MNLKEMTVELENNIHKNISILRILEDTGKISWDTWDSLHKQHSVLLVGVRILQDDSYKKEIGED